MHPAFSVIFFTTLSGAGYGVLTWLGIILAMRTHAPSQGWYIVNPMLLLVLGMTLATVGLCASVFHLGKPFRAWRSFSQWRTSWLSREGILALVTFIPALLVGWLLLRQQMGKTTLDLRVAAAVLGACSMATVACTAMIYASLRTIPAWSHTLVPSVYLCFSLLTGGLLVGPMLFPVFSASSEFIALLVMLLAMLAWRLKRRYWRDIDRGEMPASRASALGLPADRVATVFERPHTEANYLTREMGYVVARKHAARLRVIAVILFAFVPMLCVAPLFLAPGFAGGWLLGIAAVSALLGTFVERWLFFAEAKHVVTLYY